MTTTLLCAYPEPIDDSAVSQYEFSRNSGAYDTAEHTRKQNVLSSQKETENFGRRREWKRVLRVLIAIHAARRTIYPVSHRSGSGSIHKMPVARQFGKQDFSFIRKSSGEPFFLRSVRFFFRIQNFQADRRFLYSYGKAAFPTVIMLRACHNAKGSIICSRRPKRRIFRSFVPARKLGDSLVSDPVHNKGGWRFRHTRNVAEIGRTAGVRGKKTAQLCGASREQNVIRFEPFPIFQLHTAKNLPVLFFSQKDTYCRLATQHPYPVLVQSLFPCPEESLSSALQRGTREEVCPRHKRIVRPEGLGGLYSVEHTSSLEYALQFTV